MLAVLPLVAPTGFDVLTQLLGKFIKHVKHEQRSRDSGHGQQIKHIQRIRKLRERGLPFAEELSLLRKQ